MKKKLKEIAEIRFGPHEKGRPKGEVKYLLASHFDENFELSQFRQSYLGSEALGSKFILEDNDILFTGKGHRTFAWAYDNSIGPSIPSSLFYIMRIESADVLPEYLAQVLNSKSTLKKIEAITRGAHIKSIPKKELGEIKVNILPIKEQEKVVEISRSFDELNALYSKLIEERKALKGAIIDNMINEKKTTKRKSPRWLVTS